MDAEHPIPQEVSTYQFKLVGDMTIQQFIQVAGGALVSLVIYSSNMAGYVKWPLIIISFLIGVAFAFFPIEDRPLSKWLVLFMKAIYSPTVYVWNRKAVRHSFFAPENTSPSNQSTNKQQTSVQLITAQAAAAQPSQQPLDTQAVELDKLETKEKEFLNKVSEQFTLPQTPIQKSPTPIDNNQTMDVRRGQNISVQNLQDVGVEKHALNEGKTNDIFSASSKVGNQVSPSATGQILKNVQSATFAPEVAPPSPPTTPNVVVGQTLDETGKIVDGAILEIKDTQGRSVRALRTNRLGHFMIVTPLASGNYHILSEKDGYHFEPVTILLEGKVIPPIAIIGKRTI